jgi:fibronectin-binding autotransporter adhesin
LPASSAVVLGSITGGATGGQLNLNGVNQTIGGLSAGGNFTPNNITFQTGNQTLVVNGNLAVGNNLANAASSLTLADAIPGSSTLTVITNGGFIQTGLNNVGANPDAVQIDLSQIGTFYADLGASGSLRMGTLGDIPASGVGVSPNNFILAANSNVISAGAFYIGAGGMQNQPKLLLGAGTNILNADNIYLGQGFAVANRDCGIIKFYDTPSVSGSVRIRGYDGSTRANLRIGDGNAGTGGVATNIVDVSGHYADLLLGSLVLGNQPNRVGAWEQYFSFDQGVLNATNVSLSAARNGSNPASSTMTIGGGVATLGPVSLTASVASGTLNLSGGATVTAQSITSPGSGQATLDVNGATLNLSLQGFGNPATAPVIVDTFNASGTVNIGVSGTGWTVGTFTLIDYSGAIGGSGFAALNLTGLPSGVTATLVNNVANSSVDLNVTAAPPVINPNPGAILSSVAGSNLSLAWPTNSGWILQTNSVSVVQTNQWFVYPGSSSVTNVNITIDPAKLNVFFRLVHP